MRTYKFELGVSLSIVVPDQFLEGQLLAARAEDATKFQQELVKSYDEAHSAAWAAYNEFAATCLDEELLQGAVELREDDLDAAADTFLQALLKNGLRMGVRGQLLAMAADSGLGIKVAPVSVPVEEIHVHGDDSEEHS